MGITVERLHTRPRRQDELEQLFAGGWPEFIFHDRETERYLGRVRELFSDLELVLLDGDRVVAAGWAVPLRWNGEVSDLPTGYNGSLARALDAHDTGQAPDTLAILAAQVHPDRQGQGLAGELLLALRGLAVRSGWSRVICPVRPTLKARYPLTSIDRYLAWTRPDGTAFDPWIRTHQRLGATVLAAAPESRVITGTIGQWESWTGMAFPDSGDYIIDGGLSPLRIDRETGDGVYIEPNVWMRHL